MKHLKKAIKFFLLFIGIVIFTVAIYPLYSRLKIGIIGILLVILLGEKYKHNPSNRFKLIFWSVATLAWIAYFIFIPFFAMVWAAYYIWSNFVKKTTLISWIFAILGFGGTLYLWYSISESGMLAEICYPKARSELNRFIKEVNEVNIEELKNKKAFLNYDRLVAKEETTFKSKEELIRACKEDFSEEYKIMALIESTEAPCFQINYYIKFDRSIYLIKIANTAEPSFFCECPGYEVVFVDRIVNIRR